MPDAQPDQSLHLPSLVIKNFRGIDELTIPRLGRVTLLAGKNGVGKTTVLDAVRIWADRGLTNRIDTILVARGDAFTTTAGDKTNVVPDRLALFTKRERSKDVLITIGPAADAGATLGIRQIPPPWDPDALDPSRAADRNRIELERQFGEFDAVAYLALSLSASLPEAIACIILGPNGPTDRIVEQYWSEVALTSQEDRALDALNLITAAEVERVAALGPPVGGGPIQPRRMMVKVKGVDYQVPLRTLGDGAMRTYAVALALAKSSGGFLLIDEAENGIHHSIQPKFWNMVLQTAQRNNVQVIATTHSWDCVKGFAQAANELEDVEGLLVRIERVPIGLRAITYDESRLKTVARSGIEVR